MKINLVFDRVQSQQLSQLADDANTTVKEIVKGIVSVYFNERNRPQKSETLVREIESVLDKYRGRSSMARKSVVCEQTGDVYASPVVAARALGLHERLVYCVLKGSRKSTKGFSFSYA